MSRWKLAVVVLVIGAIIRILFPYFKIGREYIALKRAGKKTISDRLSEYGPEVDQRLTPLFQRQKVGYPPAEIVFIALKQEKMFEVHAKNPEGDFKKIRSYPILAASGNLGPKLREGDRQVPEGLYRIELLNPNSLYHLSMRVSYPNEVDRKQAKKEGRTNLGGDIMIHGNQVSIGCIALGDQASEDLFVLAAKAGIEKIRVIISPVDFRKTRLPAEATDLPTWTPPLYEEIKAELDRFKCDS